MLQDIDWPTVGAGAGVFFTACFATYKGWQDRKKELAEPKGQTQVIAGVIQDNASIHANTEAVRQLTASITRMTDVMMMSAMIDRIKDD